MRILLLLLLLSCCRHIVMVVLINAEVLRDANETQLTGRSVSQG